MISRLNFVVTVILLTIFATFIAIGAVFGFGYGIAFALGWGASTWLWQAGHKSRYGHYFRPPVLNEDGSFALTEDGDRAT